MLLNSYLRWEAKRMNEIVTRIAIIILGIGAIFFYIYLIKLIYDFCNKLLRNFMEAKQSEGSKEDDK